MRSKLGPCNRKKVDEMTNQHWYDDSNGEGKEGWWLKGIELSFMSCLLSYYHNSLS